MKTIKISDENYNYVKKMMQEIEQQNNRGTAKPIYFCVRDIEKLQAPDGEGDGETYYSDGDNEVTPKDVKDYILESYDDAERKNEIKELDTSSYEFEDLAEEEGYEKISLQNVETFHHVFLTEKECEKHIQRKKHWYNDPKSYVSYFSHEEIEMRCIFDVLKEIVEQE